MSNTFNPDWLEEYTGYFYPDTPSGATGFHETFYRKHDHNRFIMEQAAEYQEIIAKLQHDIQAYRGCLGYEVDGNHDGHLTDGTIPVNGIAIAQQRQANKLEADLAAARVCGSCADAFKCHYHEDSSGLNWFDVKETCDKWRPL